MTFRDLVDSLQVALKKTFDDSDISKAQIAYWTAIFVNKYNTLKNQSTDNGKYLTVFPQVPIYTNSNSEINLIAGRKYFILPKGILDLGKDGGVDYISYNDFFGATHPSFLDVKFERTTPRNAEMLTYNPYTTPSANRPYFYVIGKYVYLLGIENINVPSLEVCLRVNYDPFSGSIDDELVIDDSIIDVVYKSVMELGRFVMLIPTDQTNTGIDNTNSAQVPKTRLNNEQQNTEQ